MSRQSRTVDVSLKTTIDMRRVGLLQIAQPGSRGTASKAGQRGNHPPADSGQRALWFGCLSQLDASRHGFDLGRTCRRGQVRVEAGLDGPRAILIRSTAGQRHQHRLHTRCIGPERAGHRAAVHLEHSGIRECHVRQHSASELDPLLPAVRHACSVAIRVGSNTVVQVWTTSSLARSIGLLPARSTLKPHRQATTASRQTTLGRSGHLTHLFWTGHA